MQTEPRAGVQDTAHLAPAFVQLNQPSAGSLRGKKWYRVAELKIDANSLKWLAGLLACHSLCSLHDLWIWVLKWKITAFMLCLNNPQGFLFLCCDERHEESSSSYRTPSLEERIRDHYLQERLTRKVSFPHHPSSQTQLQSKGVPYCRVCYQLPQATGLLWGKEKHQRSGHPPSQREI